MRTRISYTLNQKCPLYPNTPPVIFEVYRSIECGDSANSSVISLSSHTGTHIDLPRHFCKNRETVIDLLDEETIFYPACCYDIPKNAGDPVTRSDLEDIPVPNDVEALIIRTGYFRFRNSKPEVYTTKNPWVHPEVSGYLRKNFPELKVFGLDTVSISNPAERLLGHESHRSFLCEKPPIMLLEDLDLSNRSLTGRLGKLTLYPVFLDELDGVPVIAFLE